MSRPDLTSISSYHRVVQGGRTLRPVVGALIDQAFNGATLAERLEASFKAKQAYEIMSPAMVGPWNSRDAFRNATEARLRRGAAELVSREVGAARAWGQRVAHLDGWNERVAHLIG